MKFRIDQPQGGTRVKPLRSSVGGDSPIVPPHPRSTKKGKERLDQSLADLEREELDLYQDDDSSVETFEGSKESVPARVTMVTCEELRYEQLCKIRLEISRRHRMDEQEVLDDNSLEMLSAMPPSDIISLKDILRENYSDEIVERKWQLLGKEILDVCIKSTLGVD